MIVLLLIGALFIAAFVAGAFRVAAAADDLQEQCPWPLRDHGPAQSAIEGDRAFHNVPDPTR